MKTHQQPIGWHPDLNDGVRWNDLNFSNETKQAARAAHERKGQEA